MVRTRTATNKIQQKVLSHKLSNERILSRYGSYEELCNQRKMYRTTNDDRYKRASNDYKNYRKHLKFIEKNIDLNFDLPTVPQSISPSEEINESAENGSKGTNEGAENGKDATEINRNNFDELLGPDCMTQRKLSLFNALIVMQGACYTRTTDIQRDLFSNI